MYYLIYDKETKEINSIHEVTEYKPFYNIEVYEYKEFDTMDLLNEFIQENNLIYLDHNNFIYPILK